MEIFGVFFTVIALGLEDVDYIILDYNDLKYYNNMKIGIFLSSYPVFSETFVHNELFYLQKNGIEGKMWCEVAANNQQSHPVNNKILFSISKTPHKIFSRTNLIPIIKAHLYWLLINPLRYLKFWCMPLYLKWWDFRSIVKVPLIALQVKTFQADLLYVHESDRAYYYAVLSSVLCNIPVGIIFHTYFLFSQDKHVVQKINSADFVICQSKYSKSYIENNFPIKKCFYNKIKVVSSPGIDTNFFRNTSLQKTNSRIIKLITVGRLEKSKGYHILVKAIDLLKKKGLKVQCKIIGEGSQKENLIHLVKLLKLDKEISFLGPISHNKKLIRHLSSAEIFILPSIIDDRNDRDMQPNAIKEAMSMRLVVITSNLGGIQEVIKDGKNGFLIKNVEAKKIAEIIAKVYSLTTSKKNSLTKEARNKIISDYEINQTIRRLMNVFEGYANK